MSNKAPGTITEEQRRKVWMRYSKEDRIMILAGSAEALLDNGESIECVIQMLQDTFACDHREVMEALYDLSHGGVEV